jgi:hypothetical protein
VAAVIVESSEATERVLEALQLRAANLPEVREKVWADDFWSSSYFAASCSGAPLEIVNVCAGRTRRGLLPAAARAEALAGAKIPPCLAAVRPRAARGRRCARSSERASIAREAQDTRYLRHE